MNASLSRLGSTAEDYERIGISPDQVASWEDGARTDGSAGTFEWWYFDTHLDDGAKLVVVFFTKEFTNISKPLAPMIRIDLDLPDGTSYNKIAEFKPEQFSTAHERCDVRIGGNSFSGDLRTYKIIAQLTTSPLRSASPVKSRRGGPARGTGISAPTTSTSSTGCPLCRKAKWTRPTAWPASRPMPRVWGITTTTGAMP